MAKYRSKASYKLKLALMNPAGVAIPLLASSQDYDDDRYVCMDQAGSAL